MAKAIVAVDVMAEDAALVKPFFEAVVADLRLLADLNATELTAERLQVLQQMNFPEQLALADQGGDMLLTRQQLAALIKDWDCQDPALIDDLASDFARIFLTGSLHAGPCESIWLDDEELVCQQPMFEVRKWYENHQLAVPNWRVMADDHLVNELLFVAHLLNKAATEEKTVFIEEAASFMDEHLLLWLLPFGSRVAQRCHTDFYAGLAMLTAFYLEQLRDLLAEMLGVERPDREALDAARQARQRAAAMPQPLQYFPGTAPSW